MFGIGNGELLVILVLALIIIGPNKLPELAKILGKGLAEFRKAADDIKGSVTREMHIEEEKRKLLDIQSTQKENETGSRDVNDPESAQIETKATCLSEPSVNPIEEKGTITKDAEKKDLL